MLSASEIVDASSGFSETGRPTAGKATVRPDCRHSRPGTIVPSRAKNDAVPSVCEPGLCPAGMATGDDKFASQLNPGTFDKRVHTARHAASLTP